MSTTKNPGAIERAITDAIHNRALQIVEEEAARAAERVRERMKELAPQVAMSVMRLFEVEHARDSIIIRVRNELVDTPK